MFHISQTYFEVVLGYIKKTESDLSNFEAAEISFSMLEPYYNQLHDVLSNTSKS